MTICRAGVATVLQLVLGVGDDKLWQALAGVVDVDDAEEAVKKNVNEEEVRKRLKERILTRSGNEKLGAGEGEEEAWRGRLWIRRRRRRRPSKGYNNSQGKSRKRRQPIERRRRKRAQPIERRRRTFVKNICE
jgi:hypothetical protein